jgi:hypothetical protein
MKALMLAAIAAFLVACETEPDMARYLPTEVRDEGFATSVVQVVGPDPVFDSMTSAALESQIVRLVDRAQEQVMVAASTFESIPVADALVRASQRGVAVRVVGDADRATQAGFAAVAAAGVPVTFGNGELFWTPNLDVSILRTGDTNKMLQSLLVVDYIDSVFLTYGLVGATSNVRQIAMFSAYEELGRDIVDIIEQMAGGTFATTLTLFDAPLSSDPNNRTIYPTYDEPLEFYTGPGEPLLKHVIDEIYDARANVWIMSSSFDHGPLAEALVYKARAGFDVRVIVNAAALERADERVSYLQQEFETIRAAGQAYPVVLVREWDGGTVVALDTETSPLTGLPAASSVMVLSQPIHAAAGFRQIAASRYLALESDIFTDASMFVVQQTTTGQQPNLDRLSTLMRQLTTEAP